MKQAWAGQRVFQILDTSFGDGQRWREILAAWRSDSARPLSLHYVALQAAHVQELDDFNGDSCGALPDATDVVRDEFEHGAVMRTLFEGDLTTGLRALRMDADLILLTGGTAFDAWAAKLLVRCCHRGTRLWAADVSEAPAIALAEQGFERLNLDAKGHWLRHYNPRWQPKNRKQATGLHPAAKNAIVVGAGLAGASTAYALARRGWQVLVLDAAPEPARGASSLPLGLMAAHTSVDDSPRSRLTRAGVHMTRSQASQLLVRGEDWDESGLLTLKPGVAPQFQAQGAWVKPQAMVNAWLSAPGIRFRGGAQVASLQWIEAQEGNANSSVKAGEWQIQAPSNAVLGRAALVVLAAAGGSLEILRHVATGASSKPLEQAGQTILLPRLMDVPGQVSWGGHLAADNAWAPGFAVNGHGYLAANIPMSVSMNVSMRSATDASINAERLWLTGATFEDQAYPLAEPEAHAQNLARLQQLLPGAAAALQPRFDAGQVQAWRQVRCTTPDRLPICGPVGESAPGLWLNVGFGARGLTWSVLCAELLAARLHNEPWPLAARLAAKLDYRV